MTSQPAEASLPPLPALIPDWRRLLVVAILVGATFWPAFFYWVPTINLQARKLAAFPSPSVGALLTPDFYAAIGTWIDDRFPFKNVFVDLNARVRVGLFNSSTTADVILTQERGWYEHRESILIPCRNDTAVAELFNKVISTGRTAGAAGKTFLFVVAPQKATLYPEKMTASWSARYDCALQKMQELSGLIDAAGEPFIFNSWKPMLESKRTDSSLLLSIPQDTHWTSAGSALVAEQMIDRLRPGLWEDASVQRVDKLMFGDLTRKLGIYDRRPVPLAIVRRSGVQTEQTDRLFVSGNLIRTYESTGTKPLLPRATIIHDSFGLNLLRQLPPFFERIDFVHVGTVQSEEALGRIRDSEIVIVLVAERFAYQAMDMLPETSYAKLFAELGEQSTD
jgi:hypothetical protein